MRKAGILILMLALIATAKAQDKMPFTSHLAQKNILNHMDVGVNVGTLGVGIDVAVPVTDYVRIRAGYTYMPSITLHSNFLIETRKGGISNTIKKLQAVDLTKMLAKYNIDLEAPKFKELKDDFNKFNAITPKDYVSMGLQPNLHQFKFLVDVMPFKHNKHWSFTTGFFIGPSNVGNANNRSEETLLLDAVTTYNKYYVRICKGEALWGESDDGSSQILEIEQAFKDRGVAGFPLGYFKDGKKAMMIPGKDGTVKAEMKTSTFRPYVGFGYNTHLSRNKKWNLNVDAGVLFLCGAPSVFVDNVYRIDENAPAEITIVDDYGTPITMGNYDIVHYNTDFNWTQYYEGDTSQEKYFVASPESHVDMINDLDINSIPGKVGNMTRTISKFKVYPNLSVTVSYRLF